MTAILPNGAWVFLGNFPYECEPDELCRFLSAAGIELTEDRVAIRSSGGDGKAYALISLPPIEVAHLVERALIAIPPLYGRKLRVTPSERNR